MYNITLNFTLPLQSSQKGYRETSEKRFPDIFEARYHYRKPKTARYTNFKNRESPR